jgi:hypothetical protein
MFAVMVSLQDIHIKLKLLWNIIIMLFHNNYISLPVSTNFCNPYYKLSAQNNSFNLCEVHKHMYYVLTEA